MVGADVHTVAIALLVTVMFAALERLWHRHRFRADNPKYQSKSHPILAAADMLSSRDPVESPDAKSQAVTTAAGPSTNGALNQHSAAPYGYEVGVAHDRGQRRTMEDAYSFIVDFGNVRGQGYFAIFDGHAGKHAAEWCGQNFHKLFLGNLAEHNEPIPDILNRTFHAVDKELSDIAAQGATHSGCTAVTAFLRLEDAEGKPVKDPHGPCRRVLYTANAGDARGVLCRGGKAVRLTYDHKGSDKQEAKRIVDAGGFVLNNRVNGKRSPCVLAVTRSLGDSAMKEFVVGSPYTTETELSEDDEFVILACDGLWDVADDQAAVDIVRKAAPNSAQDAAKTLLEHALSSFSMDNVSVLVVRFLPVGASK
ncbi:protein phosphatase 2C [Rhizoctonia solani]|uniref:Protein phosphatase 2C n=1 Tax=Rhizoctonia solani TaxID=456999 RepID=A0A8H8NXC5_9AGAM|nr:protein phosphatase 2C [Rhizoctonia solani]QRW21265.1 protein phosphatase 2C [Rhizoctonia solani]